MPTVPNNLGRTIRNIPIRITPLKIVIVVDILTFFTAVK